MASPQISLKLIVDKKSQRVLFAEGSKEFVDFLFHIFSLPLGTLIKILGSEHMVGCLGKLKDSIDNFIGTYLQPGIVKDDIFNPQTPYTGSPFLLSNVVSSYQSNASKTIYRCSHAAAISSNRSYQDCQTYATLCWGAKSPNCVTWVMNACMKPVLSELEVAKIAKMKSGYVKEAVSYMVMDDLAVKPISSITLINSFNVRDITQLEEKTVSFGKDEALNVEGLFGD